MKDVPSRGNYGCAADRTATDKSKQEYTLLDPHTPWQCHKTHRSTVQHSPSGRFNVSVYSIGESDTLQMSRTAVNVIQQSRGPATLLPIGFIQCLQVTHFHKELWLRMGFTPDAHHWKMPKTSWESLGFFILATSEPVIKIVWQVFTQMSFKMMK